MTKPHFQKVKMKPNRLYYCYETGRTVLYLESDEDNLVLIQNEHNIFVEAENNEQHKHSYVELGIANPEFIEIQLKILAMLRGTIEHIKKAFLMSQLAQMLSDSAPNVEATLAKDQSLPKQIAMNIYKTIRDMINNNQYYPFKIVPTEETDAGINFEVVLDEDKKKAIMETDEYKEFERHMRSTNPSMKDVLKTLFDTVHNDAEKPDSSKNSSDMII